MPKVVGAGALCAAVLTIFDFTGGSLKGYSYDPDMDDFDRKEKMINNRRRPLEETIAEIGEGRGKSSLRRGLHIGLFQLTLSGIKPPGYEERRRQRLKERYGIDVKTVSADVE